jgi:acetyl-CoA C-acetyltransferase
VARSDNPSVIVAGARTPIGKLSGALKDFTAMDLGGFAIKAALERSGVAGDQVDYVIMGHVLQAGQGQITARQAAVKGGIPMNVPALTITNVFMSGLDAIARQQLATFGVALAGAFVAAERGGGHAGFQLGDKRGVGLGVRFERGGVGGDGGFDGGHEGYISKLT